MGYYKKIDTVWIDGSNYAADGTRGELKKRNVNMDNAVQVDNKVKEIRIKNLYNISGNVEYGLGVDLECEFATGETVIETMDGIDYLNLIRRHSSENGVIWGDFIFLFKGVVSELVEEGSNKHVDFLENLKQQEISKEVAKNLTVKVGDIVNDPYMTVYLGEYYYPRVNLRNKSYFNQPRKYRLYSALNKDKDGITGNIQVKSGKDGTTKVMGNLTVDFEDLIEEAKERMETMFKKDIGFTKGYMNILRPKSHENDSAYILTTMVKDKKDLTYPTKEDVLERAWLCGWDDTMAKGKFERITDHWDRHPIKYKEK